MSSSPDCGTRSKIRELGGSPQFPSPALNSVETGNLPLDLQAAALAHTGAVVFITGSRDEGLPIQWVNAAFVQHTGMTFADVAGRSPRVLESLLASPVSHGWLHAAITNGQAVQDTVRGERRDGSPVWSQLTVSPIFDTGGASTASDAQSATDPSDRAATADGSPDSAEAVVAPAAPAQPVAHWVWVHVDITEHLERYAAQLAVLTAEREERAALDLIAQSSDLLMDLDRADALSEIADLLTGAIVSWAGFYLNDSGLYYAEGLTTAAPPVRTRAGRRPATQDPNAPAAVDQIQELLNGRIDGPVYLDLAGSYGSLSAAGWLQQDLETRLPGECPPWVAVHAIPGRQRIVGLLVVGPALGVPDAAPPVPQGASGLQGAPASLPAPVSLDVPDASAVNTVVQVIARRAGAAIDNVRLYAREHRLAETLQRAMLPEQADIAGLDVWTYYAPNSEHAQVGGDWYDVLQIRDDVIGVVIGDVVGHDVEAAAAMGQLRSVVRSYAYELTSPALVLDRVDHLVEGMRIPRSASLVYAALTQPIPATEHPQPEHAATKHPTLEGSWSMEYSRAGHLPPLLVRDGEVTQLNAAGGALIGFGSKTRESGHTTVRPGDVLLFYTDGLIERRDRTLRAGLGELMAAAASITSIDAAGIGEELLNSLAEAPEDDVALVVVRVPDPRGDDDAPPTSPRSRRWVLPSEPASIGRARHAVVRTGRAWGYGDSANAELVVSELVANGVLHGWGHLELRVFDTGSGLRIEVEDSNPAPPVTTDGHANRVGGFGMQIVERLAQWGWEPLAQGKLVWAQVPGSKTAG